MGGTGAGGYYESDFRKAITHWGIVGLVIAALGGGAYWVVGRNIEQTRKLENHLPGERIIKRGDTYSDLARSLQREHPSCLKDIRLDRIISELKKVNDYKPLKTGLKAKYPIYPESNCDPIIK